MGRRSNTAAGLVVACTVAVAIAVTPTPTEVEPGEARLAG